MFGRLKRTKSGQAAPVFTPRQEWIQKNFIFLKDFISPRTQGKQLGKVGTSATVTESDTDEADEQDDQPSVSPSVTSVSDSVPAEASKSRQSKKRGGAKAHALDEAILKMVERSEASSSVIKAVRDVMETPTDARKAFANFMLAEMADLSDAQWMQFRREVMVTMDRVRQQSFQASNPSQSSLPVQQTVGYQSAQVYQQPQWYPMMPVQPTQYLTQAYDTTGPQTCTSRTAQVPPVSGWIDQPPTLDPRQGPDNSGQRQAEGNAQGQACSGVSGITSGHLSQLLEPAAVAIDDQGDTDCIN